MWRASITFVLLLSPATLAQDDATLLAGPSVKVEARATTLVVRAYDGTVTILDVPPAEAAIELLDLEADRAEAIDRILAQRAAIIDEVVIENIELLVELQSTRGNQQRRREIYRELTEKLAPLDARGSLEDEISSVLNDEQRDTYRRLIREYDTALEDQARAQAAEQGERFRARQYQIRHQVVAVGRELARSYDRQIGARQQDFERLLAELALDETTENEVRRLVTEFGQRTALHPTREDRAQLVAEIFSVLTPEQRREAALILRSRSGMPGDD